MRALALAALGLAAACSGGASNPGGGFTDSGCWMTASEATGWTLPCTVEANGPEDGGWRLTVQDAKRKNASVNLLAAGAPPTGFSMATLQPGSIVSVLAYQSLYVARKSPDGGVQGTIDGALDDGGHGTVSAECPLDSPGGGGNSPATLHLDVTF